MNIGDQMRAKLFAVPLIIPIAAISPAVRPAHGAQEGSSGEGLDPRAALQARVELPVDFHGRPSMRPLARAAGQMWLLVGLGSADFSTDHPSQCREDIMKVTAERPEADLPVVRDKPQLLGAGCF